MWIFKWYLQNGLHFILKNHLKLDCMRISSDPSCKDYNARFTTLPLNWNLYLLKNLEDIVVFLGLKNFILIIPICFSGSRNARVTFTEKPQLKVTSSQSFVRWYPIHTWSDNGFSNSIVNRVMPSLYWGHLKGPFTYLGNFRVN